MPKFSTETKGTVSEDRDSEGYYRDKRLPKGIQSNEKQFGQHTESFGYFSLEQTIRRDGVIIVKLLHLPE